MLRSDRSGQTKPDLISIDFGGDSRLTRLDPVVELAFNEIERPTFGLNIGGVSKFTAGGTSPLTV